MRRKALLTGLLLVGGAGFGTAQDGGGEPTLWKVLLRRYDKDGDGAISRTEFGRDLARFRRFDKDGDGALTGGDFGVGAAKAETSGGTGTAGASGASGSGAPNPTIDGAAGATGAGTGIGSGSGAGTGATTAAPAISDADLKFFETKIRPVLATSCYECHGPTGRPRGGLRLNTREALQQGGRTGPAVVGGDLDASLLIKAMRFDDEGLQMPPKGKLADSVVADFEEWVRRGAPFPATIAKPTDKATELAPGAEDAGAPAAAESGAGVDWAKAKSFWAFRDPLKQPPPMTNDAQWAWSEIDRYLLADMEAAGLKPVGDADNRTWLRRVSFDLTGLPPTPEDVADFERDPSPQAYEKVVDRLLASAAFGERFGRHWLDVARYAESSGKDANVIYPHAWRYRDYVVASFNSDKPVDRFFTEQLAGDLLPTQDAAAKAETTVATGFLALGAKSHNTRGRPQFEADLVDEQIDAVSQAMLGLTVACARCHDHKFDPIPQRDYYAVAGVFRSTETCYGTKRIQQNNFPAPLIKLPANANVSPGPDMPAAQRRVIEGLKTRAEELAKRGAEGGVENRVRQRTAAQQVQIVDDLFKRFDENGRPTEENLVAMGARERRRPTDAKLLERGEVDQPKQTVPRGFLTVLGDGDEARRFKEGSGRLELADAIASAENPLTARVYVNRLWTWMFGRGIVPTPDNFGSSGTPPSNPALLDWLAVTFVEDGWSTKKLLKRLCLSRAYRMSSDAVAANEKVDPENLKLWRMPKRRLEGEAIRDAMLTVAGTLQATPPVGSPVNTIEGIVRGEEMLRLLDVDAPVRSVYLPVLRGHVPHALEVFDFAEPEFVTGDREETNVASQALYLMNDPGVQRHALAFADRVLARKGTDADRVAYAFELAFSRKPTASEASAVRSFVESFAKAQPKKPEGDGRDAPRRPRRPGRNAPARPGQGRPAAGAAAAPNLDPTRAAWAAFCQSLFMSAEFRYVD
jgi:cytochrome c553